MLETLIYQGFSCHSNSVTAVPVGVDPTGWTILPTLELTKNHIDLHQSELDQRTGEANFCPTVTVSQKSCDTLKPIKPLYIKDFRGVTACHRIAVTPQCHSLSFFLFRFFYFVFFIFLSLQVSLTIGTHY